MSTDYVPSTRIAFERIRHFHSGRVHAASGDGNGVIITDGRNQIGAYPPGPGFRTYFSRTAGNAPSAILTAIEQRFGVRLIPDDDEEFTKIIRQDRSKGSKLHREARRT